MSTLYFEVPAKRSPRKKAEDKATEKAEKTTAKKTNSITNRTKRFSVGIVSLEIDFRTNTRGSA